MYFDLANVCALHGQTGPTQSLQSAFAESDTQNLRDGTLDDFRDVHTCISLPSIPGQMLGIYTGACHLGYHFRLHIR